MSKDKANESIMLVEIRYQRKDVGIFNVAGSRQRFSWYSARQCD